MALAIDSVPVIRLSALSIAVSSSFSVFSSVCGGRKSLERLPVFEGLRIRPSRMIQSLESASQGLNWNSRSARGGRVVCEAQKTAVEVPAVTEATWHPLVVESESPVLVEFWAPWCGPCRLMHPIIDELAKEYAGKLQCYKVNTDECPSISTRYSIRSIPTVMIFKKGEKKDTVVGAVPKSALTKSIDKFL